MRPSSASQLTRRVISTRACDGVPLRGVHLTSSDDHPDGGEREQLAIVVGHGFTHATGKPETRRVLAELAGHADVVALDFRGHGSSGGRCSVGDTEVHDLAAAVSWARRAGYPRVATIGFSMGASVAIRHAARAGEISDVEATDAVVAVSGPARWWSRETQAMRRVHWLLEQPHGRAVCRLLGVRLGASWDVVPPSPVEVVGLISPTPLLLVHGDADRYFSPQHAKVLHRASGGHAELWLEAGMGHGESGTGPRLAARLVAWVSAAVQRTGAVGASGAGTSTMGLTA